MTIRHTTCRDHFAAIVLGTTLALAVPAAAQTAVRSESDTWQFEVTPYLFGSALSGTTGVGGVTADVDMSFGDIVENLDSGFMAMFEARKGPWGFGFDGVYFKLKDQKTSSWQGPGGIGSATGDLEATMTEQIYQLAAMYRLSDAAIKIDAIGAARYTRLDTDLDLVFTTGPLLPGGARNLSASESWWDPVIGIRVIVPLAEQWSFVGYADIGGFGVGSDVTYQVLAGVNWQFSETFSAKAGYRYFYQDYEHNGFVWDMTASGFYLGAGFRF
jgi:opacity protein-like surface antigen